MAGMPRRGVLKHPGAVGKPCLAKGEAEVEAQTELHFASWRGPNKRTFSLLTFMHFILKKDSKKTLNQMLHF